MMGPHCLLYFNNDKLLCAAKTVTNGNLLHSPPLREPAISMQEEQAVPLGVQPPKVHLSGPSWLGVHNLQIPVKRINTKPGLP